VPNVRKIFSKTQFESCNVPPQQLCRPKLP
jgi:hypothetical protein